VKLVRVQWQTFLLSLGLMESLIVLSKNDYKNEIGKVSSIMQYTKLLTGLRITGFLDFVWALTPLTGLFQSS
jgi:hypothetical protein